MARWPAAFGMAVIAAVSVGGQGPPRAPLLVAVSVGNYISETYTERPAPPALFVFFTGEPIDFTVRAANTAGPTITLKLDAPADGAVYAYDTAKNQEAFPLSVNVTSVSRIVNEVNTVTMKDERLISLDQKDRVEWKIVVNEKLEPGQYSFKTGLWARESQGRQILWQVNEMRFEVRPAAEYPAEMLVREAYRNTSKRDLRRAERAVKELLKLHPNSSAAQFMLDLIESTRGNSDRASRYRARAAEIIAKDQDTLLNKYCNRECRAARIHN